MELADVTDSKSVGGNTVRVRPPPPAPKKERTFVYQDKGSFFSMKPAAVGKSRAFFRETG